MGAIWGMGMLSSCICSTLVLVFAMKGIPIGPLAHWGKDLTYYLTPIFCLVNWDMYYPSSVCRGTGLPLRRILYILYIDPVELWENIMEMASTHMEDFFYVLLGRMFLYNGLRGPTQHFVNGSDHVQHFVLGDQPITVQVVKSEYPLQLFLNATSRHLR